MGPFTITLSLLMKRENLSQTELLKRLDDVAKRLAEKPVHQSNLNRWVSGKLTPSIESVHLLMLAISSDRNRQIALLSAYLQDQAKEIGVSWNEIVQSDFPQAFKELPPELQNDILDLATAAHSLEEYRALLHHFAELYRKYVARSKTPLTEAQPLHAAEDAPVTRPPPHLPAPVRRKSSAIPAREQGQTG